MFVVLQNRECYKKKTTTLDEPSNTKAIRGRKINGFDIISHISVSFVVVVIKYNGISLCNIIIYKNRYSMCFDVGKVVF